MNREFGFAPNRPVEEVEGVVPNNPVVEVVCGASADLNKELPNDEREPDGCDVGAPNKEVPVVEGWLPNRPVEPVEGAGAVVPKRVVCVGGFGAPKVIVEAEGAVEGGCPNNPPEAVEGVEPKRPPVDWVPNKELCC